MVEPACSVKTGGETPVVVSLISKFRRRSDDIVFIYLKIMVHVIVTVILRWIYCMCASLHLALTVFEILRTEIFDLEEVGQSHKAQFSQWRHSMANIEIYKSHITQYCANSHRFQDINIWNIWPWKKVKVTGITFAMASLNGKYQNL